MLIIYKVRVRPICDAADTAAAMLIYILDYIQERAILLAGFLSQMDTSRF